VISIQLYVEENESSVSVPVLLFCRFRTKALFSLPPNAALIG
jgi:hypothetical protein